MDGEFGEDAPKPLLERLGAMGKDVKDALAADVRGGRGRGRGLGGGGAGGRGGRGAKTKPSTANNSSSSTPRKGRTDSGSKKKKRGRQPWESDTDDESEDHESIVSSISADESDAPVVPNSGGKQASCVVVCDMH